MFLFSDISYLFEFLLIMSYRQTKFDLLWLTDQEYERSVSVDERNDRMLYACYVCVPFS